MTAHVQEVERYSELCVEEGSVLPGMAWYPESHQMITRYLNAIKASSGLFKAILDKSERIRDVELGESVMLTNWQIKLTELAENHVKKWKEIFQARHVYFSLN